MSSRHHSFSLSRSGLKPGYYVPVRLRIVDTLTVLSGIPTVVAILTIAMVSLWWADRLGLGVIWRSPIAFCVYLGVVLFVGGWSVWLTAIAVLRFVFRITGMMTEAEARHYPLRADKHHVDPWPEAWQRPEIRDTA